MALSALPCGGAALPAFTLKLASAAVGFVDVQARPAPSFVLYQDYRRCTLLIELRLDYNISYQDYHILLLLTLAGRAALCRGCDSAPAA